jgi:uncharacterized phage-associated protein
MLAMMRGFKVRKAAQVVAYFAIAEGGAINVLKLTKLVYLAEREFVRRYDALMLNDRLVSMPHGPVNSMTYNYIDGCEDQRADWDRFVSDRANHDVAVADPALSVHDLDELSEAELGVLGDVYAQFRAYSGFQLRDYTHQHCPEWEDPQGSSAPIPLERLLKFLNKPKAAEIARAIEAERALDRTLAAG